MSSNEPNPIDQIANDFTIPRHLRKIVLMLVEDAIRSNQTLNQLTDTLDDLRSKHDRLADMVYPVEPRP